MMCEGVSQNFLAFSSVVRSTAAAPSVIPEQSRSRRGGDIMSELEMSSSVYSLLKWAYGFDAENRWFFCEPTIQGVPLGWDVVEGDSSYLPEMQKGGGPARVVQPGPAPSWFRPSPVPATKNRSPAWDMALGDLAGELDALGGSSSLGPAVGSAIAEEIETSQGGINWRNMAIGITTGVTVSITTALLLDWIRGEKLWAKGR